MTRRLGCCVAAGWILACGSAERAQQLLASDPLGGGDASISHDGRRFVVSSRRDGGLHLWLYEIGARTWVRLTEEEAEDFEPRFSPDGTRLAFTSTRGGSKNVWLMSLADRSLTQLTSSETEAEYPDWSPDGREVVYTDGPWGQRHIYRVVAKGGEPRRVTREPEHLGACSYYPDGGSLACHGYGTGSGDLFRLWLDGEVSPLTSGPDWDYKPKVSPDGRWIAFSRSREGPSKLWLMPAGGGRPRPLTSGSGDDRWPTWTAAGDLFLHRIADRGRSVRLLDRATGAVRQVVSGDEAPLQASAAPNGRAVVYCADLEGRRLLRVHDLESGATQRLAADAEQACYPRWSPDGSRIAYARRDGARWEVAVVPARGGASTVLTAGRAGLRGMDGPLDWSPDGSRIVFHADTTPFAADLFSVDASSGEVVRLTDDGHFDEAPAWAPDGRSITFMSTRGGEWTWGLFRLWLVDGSVESLGVPDYLEKNFPRVGPGGELAWIQWDAASATHVLVESRGGLHPLQPDARWPEYGRDGRTILYTQVENRVEYWRIPAASLIPQPAPAGSPPDRASAAPPVTARSPVDHRRR